MEIKISPAKINSFPLTGFLIKGGVVKAWLYSLQNLNIPLNEVAIYPVPNKTPNSIWGCFVKMNRVIDARQLAEHQLCQQVCENFYISEKSKLNVVLSEEDEKKLFSKAIHIFHPEFQLVELAEELILTVIGKDELFFTPTEKSKFVIQPVAPAFIPRDILRFQVMPVEDVSALDALEKEIFPTRENIPDEPLSTKEKGKLAFYNKIFKRGKGAEVNEQGAIEKTNFGQNFTKLLSFFSREKEVEERMMKDFEDLTMRNQKELDRLMDMLANNPDEALKYAIPLDEQGGMRGENNGAFQLSKRWSNFGLQGRSLGGTGGGTIDLGDGYYQLRNQYTKMAEDYMRNGDFEKAAFVYMKLLKIFPLAAEALQKGGFYEAAAEIYLKHCNDKLKAAECYVQGNMFYKAIDLYEELQEYLKVADLYLRIKKPKDALKFYEKTVEQYKSKRKYIDAAEIYEVKMHDHHKSKELLMEGWDLNIEGRQCLQKYFSKIKEDEERLKEMERVYAHNVSHMNRESFLTIVQLEFTKNQITKEQVRDLGYRIIAEQAKVNPKIVDQLRHFNPTDKQVQQDTTRYIWFRR